MRNSSCSKPEEEGSAPQREREAEPEVETPVKADSPPQKPWITILQNMRTPTICNVHKRIMTLASSNRQQSNSTAAWMRKRMRNKNPNCNHNNNFVFYQPTRSVRALYFNSSKYGKGKNERDDDVQALEERIKSDLFTGRKRSQGEGLHSRPTVEQTERRVSSQASYRNPQIVPPEESASRTAKGEASITAETEALGLRTLAGHHKSFILALLRGKKLSKESAVLIITEFKSFAERIEPECFYCVFSYLAF